MLFRTKRVSEIRAIESKIRDDAEEKSEALRELLGTRYKDLLRAADEIAAIRDFSCNDVRDALQNMAQSASKLRQELLKKGGKDPSCAVQSTDDLDRRKQLHVVASKLKFIVDSPEVLYACLEAGDVYDAAVRYSLAATGYTQLRNTSGLEGDANRFAERRWRQVEVFREQILSAAEKRLVSPGLDSTLYSSVLAALIILAGQDHDVVSNVDGMLASRIAWIDDENRARGTDESVSNRIAKIAAVVRDTVTCMADMFWSGGECGVDGMLREVDASAADEIQRLRENGVLRGPVDAWIVGVRKWLEENGQDILAAASTSRILSDTLHAIDDVFGEERWPEACNAVLEKPPTYVFEIFTPLISDKAASVANESIQRTVNKAISDINEAWSDMGVGRHAGKQIWATISNDTVGLRREKEKVGFEVAIGRDTSATEDTDIIRTLARHNPVSNVMDSFEASLLESLSDVTALTQRVPSVANAFDEAVRSSMPRILEQLRMHLSSVPASFSDDVSDGKPSCDHLMEKALFVARTATVFRTAECVESAYCFRASIEGSKAESDGLQYFSQIAEDLSWDGYKTWANRLCLRLQGRLQKELTNDKILLVPIGWSSTAGEGFESAHSDSSSVGAFRVPTTISTALMNFVLEVCDAANRAGGFALPHNAVQFLREEMSLAAVASYKNAKTFYCDEFPSLPKGSATVEHGNPDTAIMQMLFDVLVLKQLFDDPAAESTTSTEIKDSLRAVEQQLHSAVDPIDLATCRKALQQSIDGYSSRSCILFGTITRNNSGKSAYLKRPSTSLTQASSNLVSLAATVPRFTYLPAPMPSTYSITGGTVGLSTKTALGALRSEVTAGNGSTYRKREDTSVAGYASKVSESVGRLGRGFFESLTRKVG